jgi:hypothetical protein
LGATDKLSKIQANDPYFDDMTRVEGIKRRFLKWQMENPIDCG